MSDEYFFNDNKCTKVTDAWGIDKTLQMQPPHFQQYNNNRRSDDILLLLVK